MTGDCPCARGWSATGDGTCVSSCQPGEYAVLGLAQSILRCVPCPVDTYSATNGTVVEIPALPADKQCTPCPPNSHTTATGGASSLQSCVCQGNFDANATSCQLCLADQYYDPIAHACTLCPGGTFAPAASIGLAACMCPRGQRAMRSTTNGLHCEPCPRGYYANGMGFSCTPCAPGLTTATTGSTSRLQCS